MRAEAPSKDSIRRDQIKLLASSAPEADRLTVCPIWASGTVGVGAWRVPRSLQPAAPPPLGTPGTNSDNKTERYPLRVLHIQQISFQHGCHLCLSALRHCLALARKQGRPGESGVRTSTGSHGGHKLPGYQHHQDSEEQLSSESGSNALTCTQLQGAE